MDYTGTARPYVEIFFAQTKTLEIDSFPQLEGNGYETNKKLKKKMKKLKCLVKESNRKTSKCRVGQIKLTRNGVNQS